MPAQCVGFVLLNHGVIAGVGICCLKISAPTETVYEIRSPCTSIDFPVRSAIGFFVQSHSVRTGHSPAGSARAPAKAFAGQSSAACASAGAR